MSRFRHLACVAVGACTATVLLSIPCAAHAGSFFDAFRNFVLGPQAQADTLPALQLPATSQARNCMYCHDGTAGPQITMKHAGAPMQFRGHVSIDHPVGMDYDQFAHKNPETYVLPARMDKRIVLEDGKVTCLSCHQIKSEPVVLSDQSPGQAGDQRCNVGTGYTTGPNPSQLCMGCHAM